MTLKYNFTGKVALITGSSSGIGAAIAIQFAQYGALVTITGRNGENLEKIARKIEKISPTSQAPLQIVGSLEQDHTLPQRLIEETISKYGRLDFLVNNAATNTTNGTLANPNLLADFDQVFRVNVRVPVELIHRAVPYLEKTRGNVINISSAVSLAVGKLVYPSSKAALDMVTKTSALELGPKGIRVNTINPGLVATSFIRTTGRSQEENDQFFTDQIPRSLMNRIGAAEDIANLASFLASDDARNITGSLLVDDSGWLLKH